MIRRILHGWIYWQILRIKYCINYKKVVLVLTDENHELDRQVLLHIDDYMSRKRVNKAVVFCKKEFASEWSDMVADNPVIVVRTLSEKRCALLFSLYCFMVFYYNIVFTYSDTPEDNKLGDYLRNTEVNEEDSACLALYHLRYVPELGE